MSLDAINPIDGRYRKDVEELSQYFSEYALMKKRLAVEIAYLFQLGKYGIVAFSQEQKNVLKHEMNDFSIVEAQKVKDIETKGVLGINDGKKTDHDVKSLEYYLKDKFKNTMERELELFHICLTSEDVNNIASASLIQDAVRKIIIPSISAISEKLLDFGEQYKSLVMPGRTHGQHAIPTTFGKEIMVYCSRITKELESLSHITLSGKLNGAIGNYSAFNIAYPQINWAQFSKEFVSSFGLQHTELTTQIEPHDTTVELLMKIKHINSILIGLNQDFWQYISDDYITQKNEGGAVGSSTMPQKINPIKFENSEANLGVANAQLEYLTSKLPISRFQRDLSDSAAQRYIGSALASGVIGYKNTLRGLHNCQPNQVILADELNNHWEVLAEPIQQILRRENVKGAYEKIKGLTQGKKWTRDSLMKFSLSMPENVQKEIQALTPEAYIGKAVSLTDEAILRVKSQLERIYG